MLLQIFILLLSAGAGDSLYWQKLTCPYETRHEALPRVWCKKNNTHCCTGFAFSARVKSVDEGNLEVTHGLKSFTITVLDLTFGEGVYWCGVLKNETVIKLADDYFYWSSSAYAWSISRWVLLLLLSAVATVTSLYTRGRPVTTKDKVKYTVAGVPVPKDATEECLYEDIAVAQAEESTDPQYENPPEPEPVTELE